MLLWSLRALLAASALARVAAQNSTIPSNSTDVPSEPDVEPPVEPEEPLNPFPDLNAIPWDTIAASDKSITWVPCINGFVCGKLLVPLDYKNASAGTGMVPLIKLLPDLPGGESDPKWGGPVLINPGGPGGSGIQFLSILGTSWYEWIGPQFSFISWDPRGTGVAEPSASCFDSEYERRMFNSLQVGHLLPHNKDTLLKSYHFNLGFSLRCNQKLAETGKYFGTAAVARDMLRISDISWTQAGRKAKGVNYLGASYGSLLGMTFATMFPDKVERFWLDGIMDADDYYSGERGDLRDIEPLVELFYTTCSQQPEACPWSSHGALRPSQIRARTNRLIKRFEEAPLPILDYDTITLITEGHIRYALRQANVVPQSEFGSLAQGLLELEKLDQNRGELPEASSTIFYMLPGGLNRDSLCEPEQTYAYFLPMYESLMAISCSDGKPHPNYSFNDFESYSRRMERLTPTTGEVYAGFNAMCVGWKNEAAEAVRNLGAKTKNNIVFSTTLLDPRTPNAAAHKMSKKFPGSRVLTVDSYGHGTFGITDCLFDLIPAYFANGTMPKAGMHCKGDADDKPFAAWEGYVDPEGKSVEKRSTRRSERRKRMKERMRAFKRVMAEVGEGRQPGLRRGKGWRGPPI